MQRIGDHGEAARNDPTDHLCNREAKVYGHRAPQPPVAGTGIHMMMMVIVGHETLNLGRVSNAPAHPIPGTKAHAKPEPVGAQVNPDHRSVRRHGTCPR
ncbi:hypothetical protein GCM10011326_16410 [Salipiger profundus]|nr:hypothetical protein GCM10011326_16410 [Salipiger profundus]